MTFYLMDPSAYRVDAALNPLTDPRSIVNSARAKAQHERLCAAIERAGGKVVLLPPRGYADEVFLSNAGMILGDTVILSRFAPEPRRGEEEALTVLPYRTVRLPPTVFFEGQGSCRWSHDRRVLWIGYGAGRTSRGGAETVARIARQHGITVHLLRIVDPRTYHMDLCFCPLPNGRLLWRPGSFPPAERELVRRSFRECITVPWRFAYGCNSLVVGDTLITPRCAGTDQGDSWRSWIRAKSGMRVIDVNMSEFEKAGGSVSCCVLPS